MSVFNNTGPLFFGAPPQWFGNFNSPRGKTSSHGTTYTHFFIIAVVALSLVITLVLLLHLYLRYVRRRQLREFRSRTVNLLALASFTGTPRAETPKGLDPGSILSIRSFQYNSTSANTSEESDNSVREDCAVCLSNLEEGNVVRMLPACHHVFHIGCIDKWLAANASCPVCRAEVNPREQSVSGQASDVVTTEEKDVEAEASVSSRLSFSFRRMLSRERSSRRVHGDGDGDGGMVGDLESGAEVINTS